MKILEKPYNEKARIDFIIQNNHKKGLKIKETSEALYALDKNEIMGTKEIEVDVLDFEKIEEEKQVPFLDENGTQQTDDEGNPIYETITETVQKPVMIDKIETDEEGNEYTVQVQSSHKETKTIAYPVINENFGAEQAAEKRQQLNMLSLTAADVERALYKAKHIDFDDILTIVYNQVNSHSELVSESNPMENTSIDPKALKIELKANNFYRGNPYISQIGALLGITETQLDEFFQTNDYTKLMSESEILDEEIPF